MQAPTLESLLGGRGWGWWGQGEIACAFPVLSIPAPWTLCHYTQPAAWFATGEAAPESSLYQAIFASCFVLVGRVGCPYQGQEGIGHLCQVTLPIPVWSPVLILQDLISQESSASPGGKTKASFPEISKPWSLLVTGLECVPASVSC